LSAKASGPRPVYLAKGARVYISGLLAITLPFYLRAIGYGPVFQGVVLAAILAGNALSNVAVTYLDAIVGRRRLLQGFSLLMIGAGATLAFSASIFPIVAASVAGNISSTGTEAGPFQSMEAGVMPELVPTGSIVKVFGRYNLIGYSAAALGQLTSAGPGLFGNSLLSFRAIFLGFSIVGVVLFAVYTRIGGIDAGRAVKPGFANLSAQGKRDLARLSGLFSIDSFGAVFVTTYLLSIWFNSVYGLGLQALGPIFFVATVVSAASTYGAALIAQRVGNLRTMVYTHLLSSTFLILMGLAASLPLALAFLFLRQSFSQMDVPTRQALMTEMFQREERVQAFAVTNTFRSAGSFVAGPVAAEILGLGLVSTIPFAGGGTKIAYDLLTFAAFRKRFR
jgi:MFS family permease